MDTSRNVRAAFAALAIGTVATFSGGSEFISRSSMMLSSGTSRKPSSRATLRFCSMLRPTTPVLRPSLWAERTTSRKRPRLEANVVTSTPNITNTVTMGSSHHFLLWRRNSQNSDAMLLRCCVSAAFLKSLTIPLLVPNAWARRPGLYA